MMIFNEIHSEDKTAYAFERVKHPTKNYDWYILAKGTGNPFTHPYPFNDGKFTQEDYTRSWSQGALSAFWDWFKISRRERRAFRSFWIKNCEDGQFITIQQFRERYTEMNTRLSMDDFVKAKQMLDQANIPGPHYFSFGDTQVLPTPTYTKPKVGCELPQQKGNNPMNYHTNTAAATIVADTSDKDKRQYLASRLGDLRYDKDSELRALFGFGPIDSPKNAKEALERIQAGRFTIKGSDKDETPRWGFDFCDAFSWRDPSVKQDEEGMHKAFDELADKMDDLRDVIMVKPIDEAFDTLKALKDWQPTGQPN